MHVRFWAEWLDDAAHLCGFEHLDEHILHHFQLCPRMALCRDGKAEQRILVAFGQTKDDAVRIVGGSERLEQCIRRHFEVDVVLKVGLDAVVLKDRVDLHLRPNLGTVCIAKTDDVDLVRCEFENALVGYLADGLYHPRQDGYVGDLGPKPHLGDKGASREGAAQRGMQSLAKAMRDTHASLMPEHTAVRRRMEDDGGGGEGQFLLVLTVKCWVSVCEESSKARVD